MNMEKAENVYFQRPPCRQAEAQEKDVFVSRVALEETSIVSCLIITRGGSYVNRYFRKVQ